jgi:tripartite-type tricarboxylate transporter receptor subunit TctC
MRGLIRLVLVLAALVPAIAGAQAYPSRTVRLIVPYPPGGTNDILARIMADRLGRAMGQSFVVDNRGGAGGLIGADAVAKAAPDGYTLLLSSSGPLAVGLALYAKVPYDAARDFAPIAMIADSSVAFVAYPGFKPHTVSEVIAYGKAHPGELRGALPAIGSMHHLLMELFRLRAGVKVNMIPYKGTGPAIVDLMAGNVDIDFENMPAVIPYIRSGRLRALAVASDKRSDLLPDVPTMKDLGFPDVAASPWFALVAPAGTPRDIVVRLNEEVNRILRAPETADSIAKQGADPIVNSVEATSALIHKEIDKWAKVVKETGAKLE